MSIEKSNDTFLTERFEDALIYSNRLHAGQLRKGSQVPYIAHLLGVAGLVLEDGGDEDEAIAALLHDAVEDQGGLITLKEIRKRYGPRVAEIVLSVSDTYENPKPPWRERKEGYITSIHSADLSARRVSLADKVYNARATLMDIKQEGESGWLRFNGGKEGTLWYYHQLIDAFRERGSGKLLQELIRVIGVLEEISEGYNGDDDHNNDG
ncbi:MAG: HD domain-containing protein [Anaerolineales bacterium]